MPSFSSQRRADNSRSQRSRSNARERIRPSDNANGRKRNERKISKIKRKIIFYGALSLSIIAIVVALSLTVLFKINTISIKGNEVYSQKEISAVLPIEKEANLFLIDKDRAEEKVIENLPYIYSVDIKRKLPSTVVVTITETPQVYCISNADKSYTYLDDTFKVLEEHGLSKPEGAIEIKNAKLKSGIKGQRAQFADKKLAKNIRGLTDLVKKTSVEKVSAIYSKDINNNYIEYDSRITIKLGTLDNAEKKLYAALAATEKLNETNPQAKGEITATDDKQVYFTAK